MAACYVPSAPSCATQQPRTCTISHSGLISRSLFTWFTVSSIARSTSSTVEKRPRPYLRAGGVGGAQRVRRDRRDAVLQGGPA